MFTLHWILLEEPKPPQLPLPLIEDVLGTFHHKIHAHILGDHLFCLRKRAPIQWGITHEKNGLDAYCRTGGMTLVQTGIWHHESGILGASPDGFVQGDYCGRVHLQDKEQPVMSPDIIEVKCPFSAKDMTITEACHSKKDFYL
ncbi:hypothetical protein MAR_016357, partial [Mya arenaria]